MPRVSLRRLFAAPDDAHELIATCDRGCVPFGRYNPSEKRMRFSSSLLAKRAHPRRAGSPEADEGDEDRTDAGATVQLPFPATDLSWCPAKAGADNASFLSACNSQPLQLWDCEDGELRASYVAANDSGNHTHPRCCGWLSLPSGPLLAMGGYGGHEDKSPVRFFDVLHEGATVVYAYDSSFHAGVSSSNNVVSAVAAGPRGMQGLALAGYRNHATVDVVDVRHRCPAAVLTGGAVAQRGCIRSLGTHPTREHLIFASGGRQAQAPGNECVLCWDLRRPTEPLVAMDRGPAQTHQVCDFVFVRGHKKEGENFFLVSTSSAGGLYVFDLASALLGPRVADARPLLVEELGVTSGIASLERRDGAGRVADPSTAGSLAIVVGARVFTYDPSSSCTAAASLPDAKRPRAEDERKHGDEDEEDSMLDSRCLLQGCRGGKRALAPMDEEDGDADAFPPAASPSAGEGINVRVVTLPW